MYLYLWNECIVYRRDRSQCWRAQLYWPASSSLIIVSRAIFSFPKKKEKRKKIINIVITHLFFSSPSIVDATKVSSSPTLKSQIFERQQSW